MSRTHSITINFKGGIISPGQLLEILSIADQCLIKDVSFGARQQLLIDVPEKYLSQFTTNCKRQQIAWQETKKAHANITSSYVAAGIFTTDSWLTEGTYKDVLNMFEQPSRIKINVCDSKQTFTPFFTGHLNWITSPQLHYWHLYLRMPGSNELYRWPEEVYTNYIGSLNAKIERLLMSGFKTTKGEDVYKQIKTDDPDAGNTNAVRMVVPAFHLPYYEGFNRHGNSYWLGIYRRDQSFPVAFLQELCSLCLETKIGQLYSTAWKSLIIKDIDRAHRQRYDYILNKYRINVRHAANELNWQVEDNNEEALRIKRLIIRHFDKEDVRTYGLSFGIQLKQKAGIFGSVIIRKCPQTGSGRLRSQERYDILHTSDFNPNTQELIHFREGVSKEHLGTYLVSLSKFFYEQMEIQHAPAILSTPEPAKGMEEKTWHQCPQCFTAYDEALGDIEQDISPNTPFESLPSSYCCSMCGEPVKNFVSRSELNVITEI
ncbi:rubredoxin [Danxiaibacter flavus]|uniref:Rubredoxin n=1 Tax=Danxiaibacter flavus TaxID=3049108 RepID=A0ABV3ZIJ2_9BACT|nr:rubredoxin [Chitinophagaceae bacterium DXS]